MGRLHRMKPETFVSVVIAKAIQRGLPEAVVKKQIGPQLLAICQELWADSNAFYCEEGKSQLLVGIIQAVQKSQAQQPQAQQPQAQQPQAQQPQAQQPQAQQPQAQPDDINGPTPLPPMAGGMRPAPPGPGTVSHPPQQVPVQAPPMQPQPQPQPQSAPAPVNADAPPSMTVAPAGPPTLD